MIALDTDHISILRSPGGLRRDRLVSGMAASLDQKFAASIAVLEEQARGWLAVISKERLVARQVVAYRELADLFLSVDEFTVLPFDDAAATHFDRLHPPLRRLGTMDLKIDCTAPSVDVLLLTANRRDFERVPGLRFENWLD